MYSVAQEAEFNRSNLDRPKIYRDPVTIEQAKNRDAVNQPNNDTNFPREHKMSQTQLMRHHALNYTEVKITSVLQKLTRAKIMTLLKNDDTTNIRLISKLRHDTDSTASSEMKYSTDKHDEPIQD